MFKQVFCTFTRRQNLAGMNVDIRSHHVRKSQVHVEEEFVSKLIYVFAQVCVHACLTAQKTARQKHLVRFHGCTLPSHVWLDFESG